ncbi:MAG TPA: Hsp20/alpha crystallin family protein [Balneolales bacterium]|nr:Hsp20/alpha crystallin family protein [Balneolales bacterium]
MKVVRFTPTSPIDIFDNPDFPNRFSDVLDNFFNEAVSYKNDKKSFSPKLNISENETGYQIEVAVPGIKKEDINISIKDDILIISGERKWKEDNERKYHRIESGYGEFTRELTLSDDIDKDSIEASYADGILTLSLLKKKQQESKQIEIK